MRKHKLGLAAFLVAMLSLVMASSAMADPPFPDYTVTALPSETATYDFAVQAPGVTINQILSTGSCTFDGNWKVKYTVPTNAQVGDPDTTCNITVIHSGGAFGNAVFTIKVGGEEPPPDTTDPEVTITSPADGTTFTTTSTATLTYEATDNSGAEPSCDVVNNSSVTLSVGSNTITVNCTDTAGNTGSDSVTVSYEPPPSDTTNPVVDITSPADGSITTNGTATLHFTVNDDQDASPSCSSTDGEQLVLNTGLNTFTVVCEDDAGNQGSDAVTVTYNPPPPTLTVSPGYGVEGDPGQLDTFVEFPVTLSHAWHEDIEILYWALPGTATSSDFEVNMLIPKYITIPAGSTSTVIKVRIKNDFKKEKDELLFLLHISCDLGTAGVTTGIIDDDAGG